MRRRSLVRLVVALSGALTLAFFTDAGQAQLPKPGETLKVTAQFAAAQGNLPARLFVTADVQKGWHIYSLTQPKGGPLPTKIKLPKSDDFKVAGDFKASPKAEIHNEPEVWPDVEIQTHEGKVTWYAPIELAPGVDPAKLTIEGKLNVQACNERGCLPPKDYKFTAALGEPMTVEESPTPE